LHLLILKKYFKMKNVFKTLKIALLITSSIFFTNCSQDSVQEVTTTSEKETFVDFQANAKATTAYTLKRYVFNRANGANGLGHLAVGVEIRTTNPAGVFYYYGGVENTQGSPGVPAGGNNGGWYQINSTGANMFAVMKSSKYGYNRYRFERAFKTVSLDQVNNTINKIKGFPTRGYFLSGNNCMDATYQVLMQGGGGVFVAFPPVANPISFAPNGWYFGLPNTNWSDSVNL
jgi:hypothetical protein